MLFYQTSNRFLFSFILSVFSVVSAGAVSVTFQVNMNGLPVSPEGVHIAGTFQSEAGYGPDWNPDTTQMTDANGDLIFEITVSIPAGTYLYKYINGNSWPQAENAPAGCTVGATNDRVLVTGPTDNTLPPVFFNQCLPEVVFSVDMNGIPVSSAGVHVMGNFQLAAGMPGNWDPTQIQMSDLNGDGFYEARVFLPPGSYSYLFVNGNAVSQQEILPDSCSISDGTPVRKRTFTVENNPVSHLRQCYNQCGSCMAPDTATGVRGWWSEAVFYEIFVRSFYDSNNDGIGDFKGIIQKLDYLNDGDPSTNTDLGIKGIWLMPMMQSPSYHGYDVTDYYKTEPDYGTMADFEELLDSAHARGIKVILDLVINHTSSQHPWFSQSANNQNGYRDWYVWRDTQPNVTGPWGQQVWHNRNGKFYFGLFYSGMPDLNFNHPPVRQEVENITNFWLNKGVDGFRLDAIQYLVEEGNQMAGTQGTMNYLTSFHQACKATHPQAFTVGEVWNNTATVIPYVQPQKLDACFEFDLANSILSSVITGNPAGLRNQMETVIESYPGLSYATFLTNHDIDRVFSVLGENQTIMKQAASLYLTLPGVPFLYYGEEIGMTGTGADENKRRPMQWTPGPRSGFSNANPWIGLGSNFTTRNVEVQSSQPGSLLQHYKKLINNRNKYRSLQKGIFKTLAASTQDVICFGRILPQEAVVVVSNFGFQNQSPSVSLVFSGLAPGTYYVTELITQMPMGSVLVNSEGGFLNWSPGSGSQPLNGKETWVLLLSEESPVAVPGPARSSMTIRIFPNPSLGEVFISGPFSAGENPTVEILDIQGRKMMQAILSEDGKLNTRSLSRGVYHVRVYGSRRWFYERLMVLEP